MNPELSQYVTALKVKFHRQPQDYQYILQDINSQLPSLHVPNFRKTSEFSTQDHSQTKIFPDKVDYDNHVKLYIGHYPLQKCIDESVKPHCYVIRSDQSQDKDKNGLHKKYQDKKREQAQLETKITEVLTNKSRIESSIDSIITDES